MALNPNHSFEDLGEIKCAIAEKNCSTERANFLKKLLEHNGFTVVIVKSPPPKPAKPAPKPAVTAEGGEVPAQEEPVVLPPETFTVGVTDVSFSPINSVYNRELKTFDGNVVNQDYWKQSSHAKREEGWYWM